ncbi:MAG: alpha-D-ribose 1-methylphosphonate 5-triphosphate diphosphatase [Ferruginibacter sp.]|nr:alpha-D-ribose 1-methylphosphonate 5-triphosphate diphosphatase [Cytophagales bacterium]
MNAMLIYNARVVTPERVLERGAVYVADGVIGEVTEGYPGRLPENTPAGPARIDAQGKLLLPGLIDLHTDAMDVEIVPRRGADFPIEVAFRELERRMSGCGITTVFHSLHLGYRAAEIISNSKYRREEVFEGVYQAARKRTLVHNLIHLRFELTGTWDYDLACGLIERGYVSLLSIMDHTPGQGQFGMEAFLAASVRGGMSREEALEKLAEKRALPQLTPPQLATMIGLARDRSVPVASHDDYTPEKVRQMHRAGVRVCEFPITLEVAREAKRLGMSVVGGSSNVLRGGSLSGNLNVLDGIRAAAIDSLCSDYYPPSLLHSVIKIAREGVLSMPEAVKLATLHPARAAGIADRTGSIEPGKHADLLLVDVVDGLPLVTHTIVNGHLAAQATLQPQPEKAWMY